MKAKKSFGQHFLVNEDIAARIADSLQWLDQYDQVLEVGPGKGMLTKYLLEKDFRLVVVEADRDMVLYLQKYYPALQDHIVSANFLRVPLEKIMQEKPFALIGNFPYNISSQIVFRMLKYRDLIPEMVGMFQREMADRIVARPGKKDYGVISVLTQVFYEGEMLFGVKAGSFNPPPKVNSAVIRLRRKEVVLDGWDERRLRMVVKQSFNQRRKMLRNTLKGVLPPEELQEDPIFRERPERLSVEDFIELARRVCAYQDTREEGTA